MQGKKAQTSMTINQGLMIVRLLFMVFVAVTVVSLVSKFLVQSADVKEAEGNILMDRLILSPGCLAYTDDTLHRSYPGIIDLARFNSTVLDSCAYFGESNDFAAANLTLLFLGTGKIKTTCFNEEGYKMLLPRAGLNGPGGSRLFEKQRYVLVMEGPDTKQAILTVRLLLPNN